MDAVLALAESIAGLSFERLPVSTVANTKRLILDSFGVALAGAGSRDCLTLVDLVREWGGRAETSVIGHGLRVPAPAAALVNGTMVQALDFDDTHDPSGAHTASTVLPAALAVAEARRVSGRELVAAVTAGVDLATRIGAACPDKIGWTSTAVYGAFGAAAAAARVLGLDAGGVRNALGIVLSQTAGTTQTAIEGPLSKHMQSGFAAQAGVLSALLAERGVTGVKDVLEGKFGFFALYKRNCYDRGALLAGLGHRFGSDALSLKPYPCCRGNHGAIEAALDLRASGIGAEAISGVRVMLPPVALDLVGRDFDPGDNPVVAAQFSAQFTVATAFVHGRVGVEAFTAAAIADPRVGALLQRVSVVRGEDKGDAFGPASVEVRTSDGRVHCRTVEVLRGHPDRPLTDDELMEKFTICAGLAPTPLAKHGVVALAEAVAALEGVGDVSDLTRELRGG